MSVLREAFRMPKPVSVTGMSSTLTKCFVNSIIPQVEPSDEEIGRALQILQLNAADLRCAYCGDPCTEWDHLRPLVVAKRPTGYISEIHNLVPACGKCNQSKGNKHWRKWMMSEAPRSPSNRQISNLVEKARRLEAYEKWGNVSKVPFEVMVDATLWSKHWDNHQKLLSMMKKSQETADELRAEIKRRYEEALADDF
jgi:5-methylcytosine-specific restriction endonuclease McrA